MKTLMIKMALAAAMAVGAGIAFAGDGAADATVTPAAEAAAKDDPIAAAAAAAVAQVVQTTQSLPEETVKKVEEAEREKNPPPTAKEVKKDAGVQTVIKMQDDGKFPQKDPRKLTAKEQVEQTLKKNGIKVEASSKRIIQVVGVDMPTDVDPAQDSKFFVKRDMLAKLLVLRLKGAVAASVGQVYSAEEQARIFGDETNVNITVESSSAAVARWPLFGVTMIAQSESWDGKRYSMAGAVVWSEVLHKAAKATLLGQELKVDAGDMTVEKWLEERDLALMCGPRQLIDPKGNRVYLGIAAREVGINAARDMVNREAAKASALSYLVFSLFSDVEQRLAHSAGANIGEKAVDKVSEITDLRLAQNVERRVIAGASEILSVEQKHPLSGKTIYISVYSLDQESVAKARVMAEELIATRVATELANKCALGRLQGYADQVDAAKANTEEFDKGRAEGNAAIEKKLAPKGRTVSEAAAAPVAEKAKSQKGTFTGESKINNDF